MADEITTETTNETPTPEDYAAIKLELEAERTKTTELVAEATKPFQLRITALENTMAEQQIELNAKVEEIEGAKAAYAYAVEDYKKLVLTTNPLFTIDIIGGDTIDAVKTSVEKAGFLVNKVKEGLESQAQALAGQTTVPAGAPARTGQDTSTMTTKEKITLGLEQAKKKKE